MVTPVAGPLSSFGEFAWRPIPASGGVTLLAGPEEATRRDSGCFWLSNRRWEVCNQRQEGIYGLDLYQHYHNREDPSKRRHIVQSKALGVFREGETIVLMKFYSKLKDY